MYHQGDNIEDVQKEIKISKGKDNNKDDDIEELPSNIDTNKKKKKRRKDK